MGYPPREFGPPDPLPEDSLLFPTESARDIDTHAWARRFTDAFRFKTGQALARIAKIVTPTAALSKFNPESYWPEELLCFNQGNAAAGAAGNFSRVALYNPAGSGVLAIITSLAAFIAGGAAATLQIGLATTTVLSRTTTSQVRDLRGGTSLAYIHTDNNGTVQFDVGPWLTRTVGANGTAEWVGGDDNPIAILAPASGLIVVPSSAVIGLAAEWRWRERAIIAA